jgi:hypothetical protein
LRLDIREEAIKVTKTGAIPIVSRNTRWRSGCRPAYPN